MTLLELQARVNAIIEEHNAIGWGERNNQEIIIEVKRSSRTRTYHRMKHLQLGSLGITDNYGLDPEPKDRRTTWYTALIIDQNPTARYGGKRLRKGK